MNSHDAGNTHDTGLLGNKLIYKGLISMTWKPLVELSVGPERDMIKKKNEEVLRTISLIEEHMTVPMDDSSNNAQELLRIDFKLNLLLELVGDLVAVHHKLPPPVRVSLTSKSIEWTLDDIPKDLEYIEFSLFFSKKFPWPVILQANIDSYHGVGNACDVSATLVDLTQIEQNWLEKLIFRSHRREVASSRQKEPLDNEF